MVVAVDLCVVVGCEVVSIVVSDDVALVDDAITGKKKVFFLLLLPQTVILVLPFQNDALILHHQKIYIV